MGNYNNALFYKGLYLAPELVGEDVFFKELNRYDDDYDGDYEEMGQVFRILLDEGLIEVYWTEDDKFYLEDATTL